MSVEFLHQIPPEYARFLGIPTVWFIGWLWYFIRQERHKKDGTPLDKIEVHHKKRRWQGGKDTRDNLVGLTIVEHAEEHYKAAKAATDNRTRRAEYGAVNLIKKRMTDQERDEFNKKTKG